MTKERRGYGTMIVVSFGALGAVFAAFVAHQGNYLAGALAYASGIHLQNWQIAYLVGGVLGLLLLILRMQTLESSMFKNMAHANISKGNFFALFKNSEIFFKIPLFHTYWFTYLVCSKCVG